MATLSHYLQALLISIGRLGGSKSSRRPQRLEESFPVLADLLGMGELADDDWIDRKNREFASAFIDTTEEPDNGHHRR